MPGSLYESGATRFAGTVLLGEVSRIRAQLPTDLGSSSARPQDNTEVSEDFLAPLSHGSQRNGPVHGSTVSLLNFLSILSITLAQSGAAKV